MRKYLLLIISILFTFCLVSCDKDDEPNYVIRKYGYYSYLDTISNVTIQKLNELNIPKFNKNPINFILSNLLLHNLRG